MKKQVKDLSPKKLAEVAELMGMLPEKLLRIAPDLWYDDAPVKPNYQPRKEMEEKIAYLRENPDHIHYYRRISDKYDLTVEQQIAYWQSLIDPNEK